MINDAHWYISVKIVQNLTSAYKFEKDMVCKWQKAFKREGV